MLYRYGIDLGGVIIGGRGPANDTSFFSENYLRTPPVDQSFDGVKRIVDHIGKRNVFIVSKAGANTQRKSLEWLMQPFDDCDGKNFFEYTGTINTPDYIWFCRERRDKTSIAAHLGITHFIDDRGDVLRYMIRDVPHRLLFGPQDHPAPPGVELLPSWRNLSLPI